MSPPVASTLAALFKALLSLAVVAAVLIAVKRAAPRSPAPKRVEPSVSETPTARDPMTEREQAMYFRLRDALPQHIVLA